MILPTLTDIRLALFVTGSVFCAGSLIAQNDCGPPKGPSGEQVTYFPNGKIHTKAMYINGIFDGYYFEYYESGKLCQNCNYKYGQKEGKATYYYPSGAIREEANYRSDYRSGTCTTYFENGKTKSRGDYASGICFSSEEWWENGNLKEHRNYSNSGMNGKQETYYENGQRSVLMTYANGKLQGEYSTWYDNGQLENTLLYNEDKCVEQGDHKTFHKNGHVKEQGLYMKGSKQGLWNTYSEDGLLAGQGTYRTGIRAGIWKDYYPSGKVKSTTPYMVLSKYEGFFSLKHGLACSYSGSGDLLKIQVYVKDQCIQVIEYPNGSEKDTVWKMEIDKNTAEGIISAGKFRINKVIDTKGKKLLRNGNGFYNGPYFLVADWMAMAQDSLYFQQLAARPYDGQDENDYTGNAFQYDWDPLDKLQGPEEATSYLPAGGLTAKGRFHNGLKEGEWMEGQFRIENRSRNYKTEDEPDNPGTCYARGNYVRGLREGVWTLCAGTAVFEGNFIHGKKTGEWKSRKRIIPEKYKGYVQNIYAYSQWGLRFFADGFYKNNRPDSLWTVYYGDSEKKMYNEMYRNGVYIGKVKEYYSSGKLKMEASLVGDTIGHIRYFSPLGDVMEVKQDGYENEYCAMKNNLRNGRYYSWQGEKITTLGWYEQGMRTGKWYDMKSYYDDPGAPDTTARYTYANNSLNGNYEKFEYGGWTKGEMVNGERDGIWAEYQYDHHAVIMYEKGQPSIVNYWKGNTQLIQNGQGKLTIEFSGGWENNTPDRKEEFYKNGKVYRWEYYYKDGRRASETYVTAKGDSLVYYASPYGGLCVVNGEGTVTNFDNYKRIESISYYEKGKLQKKDFYYKGVFVSSDIYFQSGKDPFSAQPIVRRKIQKTKQGDYLVEILVSNFMPGPSILQIKEIIPLGITAVCLHAGKSRFANRSDYVSFTWANYPGNEFKVSYKISLKPGVYFNPEYKGKLEYIEGSKKMTVEIDKSRIEYLSK